MAVHNNLPADFPTVIDGISVHWYVLIEAYEGVHHAGLRKAKTKPNPVQIILHQCELISSLHCEWHRAREAKRNEFCPSLRIEELLSGHLYNVAHSCRHGLDQRGSEWYDGVGYITQCPIPVGSSFTYRCSLLSFPS